MEKHQGNYDLFKKYTDNFKPGFKEIAHRIYSSVLKAKSDFDVDIKWQQFTFAQNHDFHHWICAIKPTQKSVDLVFHYGGLLEDKNGIFKAGTSKFIRKPEFLSINDVRDDVINDFISQALAKWQYFKDNWKEINKR